MDDGDMPVFFIKLCIKWREKGMAEKYDYENGMPYNPKDNSIWYNNEKMRDKVEKIRKSFGEPFLITKTGELLYEDCVVIPTFRDGGEDE
ncbi:MAG: hypothetical protein WC248_05870 [Candidatus Methanomethylophilaceae archaeon]